MIDGNGKSQIMPVVQRQPWDDRVKQILNRVQRRGRFLLVAGYVLYAGGSYAIFRLIPDRNLAFVVQMIWFQVLVIYMSVGEVYPCIRGTFEIGLEQSRDTIPVFEDLSRSVKDFNSALETGDNPTVKRITDAIERMSDDMKRVRERIEKDTDHVNPRKRIIQDAPTNPS